MKFGLTDSEYQFILENVVIPLEQAGAKLWCFGSRARGDQKQFSDLDIMIESTKDLRHQVGNIKELLSQSNFPYKVDLVQLSEFAPSYVAEFQKDKVPFSSHPKTQN